MADVIHVLWASGSSSHDGRRGCCLVRAPARAQPWQPGAPGGPLAAGAEGRPTVDDRYPAWPHIPQL